ncbi:hypothetical protein BASA50_005275 [Batrachochytrium salamandrivorans]|uniref:Uncharacterized protein n=1 Tax=Batrachochytrium salamandrivorans TaxID=1357716 RepID=A0ABQ8FGE6_9FUNG|nr:hypothetical protein BASA60_009657 [Batrachochytrium salamandrivorans]KAH6596234.1 hypothetical protein BASA50_005275 [Batrachochytrium salamandrivorans]
MSANGPYVPTTAPSETASPPANDTADRCVLHTRFRLGKNIVNIVREDGSISHAGHNSRVVVLGTTEHMQVVTERIVELHAQIAEQSLTTPTSLVEIEAKNLLLNKLRFEIGQRTSELYFLRANISKSNTTDNGNDETAPDKGTKWPDADSTFDLEAAETVVDDSRSHSSLSDSSLFYSSTSGSEVISEAEVLHVTAETFGGIQKLKVFDIKRKDRLLRVPKLRQYFCKDVLYRGSEERKTSWVELFVDLIYVGVIAKAGHIVGVGLTWSALNRFALLIFPILQHWRGLTIYNNQFFHEDLYLKVCATYAFDSDPEFNTSSIFLGAYIASKMLIVFSTMGVAFIFERRFRWSIFPSVVVTVISLIPFVALLCIPPNGATDRDNLRIGVWWCGNALEFIMPSIGVLLARFINTQSRLAVNIEHFAERTGAFFVIALGEIVLAFLYDSDVHYINGVTVLTLFALLIAVNLNQLYFRAEGTSHYQHALRRHWCTGVMWSAIHFPLYASTITLGAMMAALIKVGIQQDTPAEALEHASRGTHGEASSLTIDLQFRTLFTASFAVVYVCFGILRLLHREHPQIVKREEYSKSGKSGKRFKVYAQNIGCISRIMFKFIVALIVLVCGITITSWGSAAWLGFVALLSSISVLVEEWGRLRYSKKIQTK